MNADKIKRRLEAYGTTNDSYNKFMKNKIKEAIKNTM